MNIKSFIIHRLKKEPYELGVLKKGEALLDIDENVVSFVDQMRKVYYKSAGVRFGSFDENRTSYPYQTLLKSYFDTDSTFVQFTHAAADHLKSKADSHHLSKGGYVVFTHFEDESDWVSILLLNDKSGYAIDPEALKLKGVIHLEMDKVHVANAVNVTKWQNGTEPYLSFVEGTRDLAKYFTEFVGCTTVTNPIKQSKALSKAIPAYLRENGSDEADVDQKTNAAYEYCRAQKDADQPIFLAAVAAIINPEAPESFMAFAHGNEYEIDDSFLGNLKYLRNMRRITFSSKTLRISFEQSLLSDGKIIYEPSDNSLKIMDLPAELKEQIAPNAT